MTRTCACFIVLAALAAPAFAAEDPAGEILTVQAARFKAMLDRDAKAVDRILSDDFVYCHTTGRTNTRQQFLESVEGRLTWQSIKADQPLVRVHGNTAIVSGVQHWVITPVPGNPQMTVHVQNVEVFVKRDGRWQLTHSQSNQLAEQKPAAVR